MYKNRTARQINLERFMRLRIKNSADQSALIYYCGANNIIGTYFSDRFK